MNEPICPDLQPVHLALERKVTENDSEFLMRTLTPHQWEIVARKVRAEVQTVEDERDFWKSERQEVQGLLVAALTERDALRERMEALADDWDAPLGNYQWFAEQIRQAIGGRS